MRNISVPAAIGAAVAMLAFIIIVVLSTTDDRAQDSFASDYCAENGAIAVGQYCLTEQELVLRRVPERFP